jgi:hypothetical protein
MSGNSRAGWHVTAVAVLVLSFATNAGPQPSAATAEQLIAAVLDARTTTGFRIRAKLTRRTDDRPDAEVSRPLLITGRREGRRTAVVYEEPGSRGRPGRAVLVEDHGDHRPFGTRIEDSAAAPLGAPGMMAPFFDSDLSIEDVFEGFWYWRSHTITGHETLDRRRCVVIEFRPDPGTQTHYTRVVAWIASDLVLPLRIELFGPDGGREKRITAGRIVKRDGRWSAARLIVEPAGGRTRTVLEGTRFERDLVLPASQFTIDAILRRLRARD